MTRTKMVAVAATGAALMFGPSEGQVRALAFLSIVGAVAIVAALGWLVSRFM
jgi:flagellar biogenesis protein FliO